jgi:exonuclease III
MQIVASGLAKYSLDLVAVQETRWNKSGSQPADDYTFFHGNGNSNHHSGSGILLQKSIIAAVERVEFISDSMSYITLRGRWCDIVLNAPAPHVDKSNDKKDSFMRY